MYYNRRYITNNFKLFVLHGNRSNGNTCCLNSFICCLLSQKIILFKSIGNLFPCFVLSVTGNFFMIYTYRYLSKVGNHGQFSVICVQKSPSISKYRFTSVAMSAKFSNYRYRLYIPFRFRNKFCAITNNKLFVLCRRGVCNTHV